MTWRDGICTVEDAEYRGGLSSVTRRMQRNVIVSAVEGFHQYVEGKDTKYCRGFEEAYLFPFRKVSCHS